MGIKRLKPSKDSAYMDCENYIKDNHLEYIADEIRKAYRRGWDFGTKKQPTISAKLARENAVWETKQTEVA